MIPLRRHVALVVFKLIDIAIMAMSCGLSYGLLLPGEIPGSLTQILGARVEIRNVLFFTALCLIWHAAFALVSSYRSQRLSSSKAETLQIVKATILATLGFAALAWIFGKTGPPLFFYVLFWVFGTVGIISWRLLLRLWLQWIRTHGRNLRYVAIMGASPEALNQMRIIESRPELGYRFIGFVHDDPKEAEAVGMPVDRVVTDSSGFAAFVRDHVVDEVWMIISTHVFPPNYHHVAQLCRKMGIVTRSFLNGHMSNGARLKAEVYNGDHVVSQYPGAMEGWPTAVKRLLDVTLSIFFLVLSSPVFLAAAFMVAVSSPGPVIFSQERVGLNRRKFRMYKFRTMIRDAEEKQGELEELNEASGPVFKIRSDPRLTGVGKVLRKTSIDELPQLVNVLQGDMSLVGPRPLPVRDFEGFYEDRHQRRFSVRPGMTCLWQVMGRSGITFEKWMELDLEYVDRWSLWLDFKILIKTVPAVLTRSGAA